MLTFFKAMSVIIFCIIFVVLFNEEIITEKSTIGSQIIICFQAVFVVCLVFLALRFELYPVFALFDCGLITFCIMELYDKKNKY